MDYLDKKAQSRVSRISVLMAEYQVCATRADFHTNLIWSWGAALVGVNAAGVGLLAQADKYSEGRFASVVLLAAAGSFLIWWWNLAADRWHVIIRVSYVRLQDIEALLGMRHNTYIDIHNQLPIPAGLPNADLQRRLRLQTKYPEKGSVGLKSLRTLLNIAVPIAWALVVGVEAFTFVSAGKPCLSLIGAPNCRPFSCSQYFQAIGLGIVGCLPLVIAGGLMRNLEARSRRSIESKKPV